ncbi:MAG: hypothetical protein HYW78_01545 [Parcubacteria group bacterium]|nr:hypothetical protein [Parcubacteria group bacterium]
MNKKIIAFFDRYWFLVVVGLCVFGWTLWSILERESVVSISIFISSCIIVGYTALIFGWRCVFRTFLPKAKKEREQKIKEQQKEPKNVG